MFIIDPFFINFAILDIFTYPDFPVRCVEQEKAVLNTFPDVTVNSAAEGLCHEMNILFKGL